MWTARARGDASWVFAKMTTRVLFALQTPRRAEALRSMRVGDVVTTDVCGVTSNELGEGEGEGEAGGLLVARGLGGDAELDTGGAVGAAGPEGQVWGGAAEIDQGVLGAFVGDDVDCSERLVARQAKALQPLRRAVRLRDTQEIHVAMQVQMMIVRYCANTQLNYFLRAMPLIVGKRVKAVSLARRTQIGWLYTWYSRRNATRPRSADHIYRELQLYSRTLYRSIHITVCTVRCTRFLFISPDAAAVIDTLPHCGTSEVQVDVLILRSRRAQHAVRGAI